MDSQAKLLKHPPTPEQHMRADALWQLCQHLMKDSDKERYITLDAIVGKSKKHKNAISIHANRTSFMVKNWSAEDSASVLGMSTFRVKTRNKDDLRLAFSKLTTDTIVRQFDFFNQLAQDAFRESQRRQSEKIFTGTAS